MFLSWLHLRWVRRLLVSIVAVAVVIGVLYGTGWYPIMTVNGSLIAARSERISFRLAQNFYRAMETQAGVRAPQDVELEKAVYDGLADDILIRGELRTMLSPTELEEKTALRIQDMTGTPQAREQVLSFTKASQHDTEVYFLEPLARQQILGELLAVKRSQDAGSWLLSARASAHVRFLFARGIWDGEKGYGVRNN